MSTPIAHSVLMGLAKLCSLLLLIVSLTSCQQPRPGVTSFTDGHFPEKLSDWNIVFVDKKDLVINESVVPYDINTPLFTDYAHKLRTIWLPPGSKATYDKLHDINLPVGSIVSKTFFYPRSGEQLLKDEENDSEYSQRGLNLDRVRLIETRLLIHLETGWKGLPYVWDEDQQDATLEITGAAMQLQLKGDPEFTYIVPDFNQCQGCHIQNVTRGEMAPIGIKVRHLNKPYSHLQKVKNQLTSWQHAGLIASLPSVSLLDRNAQWRDQTESFEHRARSYLDINCGHCHNRHGAGDTSGLFLDISESNLLRLGLCKPPVAAGQGTGGRQFDINPGNADSSILNYRMRSLDPGAMMPELGRSTTHSEGIALIDAWVNAMEGDCLVPESSLPENQQASFSPTDS